MSSLVAGSGDDDLLDGRAQVRLGLGAVGEVAGGFDDDLRADFRPGQLGGVALGPDLDLLAIDGDEVFAVLISFFRLPRIESYLSRWASVAGLVKSLTATKSISGLPRAARKTLRPMRPKPLIPTLTAMCDFSFVLGDAVVLSLFRIAAFGV